jgi:hypothetical protein
VPNTRVIALVNRTCSPSFIDYIKRDKLDSHKLLFFHRDHDDNIRFHTIRMISVKFRDGTPVCHLSGVSWDVVSKTTPDG